MRTKFWSTGSGRIELGITSKDAAICAHPGDCEADVKVLMQKRYIKKQLDCVKPEILASELEEYGAWNEEELANHKENLVRMVWIAAGEIADGKGC